MAVRTAAIQRKDPHGCAVKAYPWLGDKPACTLLEIDCDNANTTGVSNDIATLIAEVDPYRVLYLSFRHCPALEVPQTIQTLENLKVLRFDNSTIAQWTQEAAITNTHHKHLVMVLLTRVNLTNIPEGFLDPDFPQGLQDIEFCVTNLSSVPDQLDKRWPRDMWFTMDHARFDAIPDTFVRMQPGYLSMFGNQITKIQASALLNHAMVELSGNPIEALPDLDPNDWSHASDIRFADTSVRARPNWMTVDFMQTHVVVAGNTPLCSDPTALPAGVDREDICVPAAMFDCDSFYDQEWELM
ncbi:TPA: hypothetical protein N0F65_004808 [Lagenidium giganteum]|uniref:Uncharacterized protein n=1 Tax=Lagenidium giganteum TaxID=4803 RepID=A0AAV2Z491_9STRA|nr:TPA: hypothetical protein N0F65_004808 [Lagenidium giganteum]